MDSATSNQTESLWDLLQNQLDMLLAVIARPIVQQQIVAMLFILLISWLLPEWGRRWWQQHHPVEDEENESPRYHRLVALYHLYTPVLALILLYVTIWLFAQQNIPNGLLENLTFLIWFWLFYRVLISLIIARFGESSSPYRNWIITPIFCFFVLVQLFSILPGSITLVNATISLGTISVLLGNFILSLLVLYLFFVGAWVIKQLMIQTLPRRLNAEPGLIESIATLTRYFLLSVGIVFSLSVLGINFSSLAIVAGGLSVGIGIGMQDMVSNFVSGLVLLFEQSLRPGDVIEIDGRISRVQQINLRATTVRMATSEEVIIPNSKFTSEQVKNFTRSDHLVQVLVPFGVAYNSDPKQIKNLAIETVLQHPLVLPHPLPDVRFSGYGDSSLDFNLLVSINQPYMSLSVRSDIYYMLWDVFAEHNVEIPFPQRDLNLGSGWGELAADLSAPRSADDSGV